jgi:Gpi18-like mannosyltransferase
MKRIGIALWRWEPFRRSVTLYLLARVGLSLWAALVLSLVPAETGPSDPARPYLGITPANEGLAGLLLGPWQRFDTLHYIYLASHGYEAGTSHTVFPPLYPFLIRVVGGLLGGQYLLASLLISNLSAIGYFVVFFMLAEQEVGPAAARRAQVYMVLYPWAFFLLAGYSEVLFLLLIGLALWMAQRERGWAAGLCGGLAALTRLQGGTLSLLLLFEALRARRFRLLPLKMDLLWPLFPGLTSIGFLLGRAWVGIEPISVTYAVHWHQTPALPWVGMVANLRNMLVGTAHPTDYLDFLAGWLFVVLTVVAWRRLHPIYALYMTVAMLFNVSYLRTPHPLSGMGRHTMELLSAFFLLGRLGERNAWLNRLILYPSIALFLYLSAQFVLWGWVG